MSAVLEVSDLQVTLRGPDGRVPVVRGVGFELPRGQVTGLAGESGSGKTMTALALMGLLPDGAEVSATVCRLDGEALLTATPSRWRELRGRSLAMVFQDPATALDPVLTVGRQLRLVLRRTGMARADIRRAALAALADAGFRDPDAVSEAFPHELSGGMRQLVMIAMAGVVRPDVLLADEPTTALDVTTQAQVLRGLRRMAEAHRVAVLLISHDLRVLAQCCERVLVMRDGELVDAGPPRALFTTPEHEVTRGLVAAIPRLRARPAPSPPRQAEAPGLLDIEDLHVSYAGRRGRRSRPLRAVDGISLGIRRGEIVGLAGESGSGKSSLARAVVGLLVPQTGKIRFDGDAVPPAPTPCAARQRIQIVFQDPAAALSPRRTVAQSLSEPLAHFGIGTRADRRTRMVDALEAVGLGADALPRWPHQFSSGQRQRIAIARALVCEPELLVADEAVSALDVTVQARVLDLLADLRRERGIGILFISHDLAVVRQIADTVGVMFHGRLVEYGPADRMFDAPAHPYTRELLDALPSLDPDRSLVAPGPRAGLGTAPENGCVYQARCPRVTDRCRREPPRTGPGLPGAGAHRLECHHPLTGDADHDETV